MRIKRMIAMILAVCLLASCACAEGKDGGSVLDAIGSWFGQAWEDAASWISQAWKDALTWMNNVWGDSSKWIEQAWNDSSAWVTSIWGDVSTWATETYDSASETIGTWWTDTFNTVTKDTTWDWIDKEKQVLFDTIVQKYNEISSSVQRGTAETERKAREIFSELLKQIHIQDMDISKILETIQAYANEKGISITAVEQILLPYLTQLMLDSQSNPNAKIPSIAVAQYLTGVFEKIGITTEEQAKRLIESLEEILIGK